MILVAMENLNLFVTKGTGMSSMWENKWGESESFGLKGFSIVDRMQIGLLIDEPFLFILRIPNFS